MASVSTDAAGRRRVLFADPQGGRKTIYLGKIPKRAADGIAVRVEHLLTALLTGESVDADTARWLAAADARLLDKLAKAGLIAAGAKATARLGEFLDSFLTERVDAKPATKLVWGHVVRNLKEHFGHGRDMATINEGDADGFKLYLVGLKLAPTTVAKRLQFARMFFRAATRRKLIAENPFADVSSKAGINLGERRFVTPEEMQRILAACNPTWRTIVGLARYGGLRTPSETLSLRWQDVNWETGRITVQSPKTEHHPGKESRVIPLFAELRPILEEAWELAPEGAVYVVGGKYRQAAQGPGGWANANLRTTFGKIVRKAGLQQWPRLFHALRSSRETELARDYPIHVVTGWLGNTTGIALKHYLLTTDTDFDRASGRAKKTTQNPTQSATEMLGNAPQADMPAHEKTPVLQGFSSHCEVLQSGGMEDRGLEPLTFWLPARRSPN